MRWLLLIGAVVLVLSLVVGVAAWRLALAADPPSPVLVTAVSPGSTPLATEQTIVIPLEHALATSKNVKRLRSVAGEGVGSVLVEFSKGDDFTNAQQVREALRKMQASLPSGVLPTLNVLPDERERAHHRYVISGDRQSLAQLTAWFEETFRPAIEVQQGITRVEACGQRSPELHVTLDLVRLSSLAVPPDSVLASLRELSTVLNDPSVSIEQLAAVPVGSTGARLEDVATIESANAPPTCEAFDERQAVVIVEVTTRNPQVQLSLPPLPVGIRVRELPAALEATQFASTGFDPAVATLAQTLSASGPTRARAGVIEVLHEQPIDLAVIPLGVALKTESTGTLVRWQGAELEELTRAAEAGRSTLIDARASWVGLVWPPPGKPERKVTIDRSRAPSPLEVATVLELIGGGHELHLGRQTVRVLIAGAFEDALQLTRLRNGMSLSDVVKVELHTAPASILRVDSRRALEVPVGLDERRAREALAAEVLPPGVTRTIERLEPH